jgi:hypothetical protein
MNEELWAKLFDQIQTDLAENDHTAIYELLCLLPDDALNNYVAEVE